MQQTEKLALQEVLRQWRDACSNLEDRLSFRVIITPEKIELDELCEDSLLSLLEKERATGQSKEVSITINKLTWRFRRQGINPNDAVITDFLVLFPTQKRFLDVHGVGHGCVNVMNTLLNKHELKWPEK